MDYFGRMGRDFDRLQRSYGGYKTNRGMQPADWAGIGLQVGGAMLTDKAASEEQEREDEQRRLEMMLEGRRERTAAGIAERGAQQTDRSQNMTGFQLLSDQRGRSMENARRYSFRNSFLTAMGA